MNLSSTLPQGQSFSSLGYLQTILQGDKERINKENVPQPGEPEANCIPLRMGDGVATYLRKDIHQTDFATFGRKNESTRKRYE